MQDTHILIISPKSTIYNIGVLNDEEANFKSLYYKQTQQSCKEFVAQSCDKNN